MRDDQSLVGDRRCGSAEVRSLAWRWRRPELLAGCRVERGDDAADAAREHLPAVEERRCLRAGAVCRGGLPDFVRRRIRRSPQHAAVRRVQRGQHLVAATARERIDHRSDDERRGVSLADVDTPSARQLLGPRRRRDETARRPVAAVAAPLRVVERGRRLCGGHGCQQSRPDQVAEPEHAGLLGHDVLVPMSSE